MAKGECLDCCNSQLKTRYSQLLTRIVAAQECDATKAQ
jgi:hypothetical protein